MMLRSLIKSLGVSCALLLAAPTLAKPTFEQYVEAFKVEAVDQGYDRVFLDEVFANVKYRKSAVKKDRNQPEFKVTLDTYLPKRLPQWKVDRAVKLAKEHAELLQKVSAHYGVQPRFIVALWGMESNFGKIQGNYPVISSLSTMAYDGRREAFFRKQLFSALKIIREGHIEEPDFKGSWAGATGQSQFIPSSFLNYAQDFNGDGKKDIWKDEADVFASIANYLKTEGWDNSSTWGRQVFMPQGFDTKLTGLKRDKMKTLAQWQALGIRRLDGRDLPERDIKASLIMPDDENGRIYLVYENFHTLMDWNRSTYFGASVGHLADRIKLGR